MKRSIGLFLLVAIASIAPRAHAQATAEPTYWQDVRPILRKHCTVCHSAKNLKEPDVSGGLALDTPEAVRKGLGATPVVRPGQADDSLLIKVLVTANPKKRMPLDAPPLPKETIEIVHRWIARGAKDGTQPKDETDTPVARAPSKGRKRDVLFPVSAVPPPELGGKGSKLEWGMKIGPLAPVAAVAFSPDSRFLAAGSFGQVAIWDLAQGKLARLLTNVLGAVNDLKFSPDGKILAVAGGQPSAKGDLRLYQTADWKLAGVLRGHDDVVFAVAFDKEGKRLASASFDHTVKLWDLAGQKVIKDYTHHSDFVYSIAFDPAGKYAYTASKDRTVQMVDLDTGKMKYTFTGGDQDALAVAVSPDGKMVLSAGFDSGVIWWNSLTGEKVKSTGGHGGGTNEIAFTTKGHWYVSCGADRTMRVVDAQAGTVLKTFPVGSSVYACAFSADAKLLASGSADGVTRVWNASTAAMLVSLVALPGTKDQPQWLAIAPQGYLAGDESLMKLGRWRAGGKELAETALRPALEQPALIGQALRGEAVPDVKFKK